MRGTFFWRGHLISELWQISQKLNTDAYDWNVPFLTAPIHNISLEWWLCFHGCARTSAHCSARVQSQTAWSRACSTITAIDMQISTAPAMRLLNGYGQWTNMTKSFYLTSCPLSRHSSCHKSTVNCHMDGCWCCNLVAVMDDQQPVNEVTGSWRVRSILWSWEDNIGVHGVNI